MKALFFDIDGTLLSHRYNQVPPKTVEALRKCREAGHMVFVATGRAWVELQHLPIDPSWFDGFVLLNGQICLDKKQELVFSKPLHRQDVELLMKQFKEKKHPLMFVPKDRMYINYINEDVIDAHHAIVTALPPVEDVQEGESVYLAVAYVREDDVEALMAPLHHCRYTRWSNYGIDILDKCMSKVVGIKEMMNIYHISREDVICFGDGDNDIEMLQFASIGVAMGNSSDNVKACADMVCAPIDDDGLSQALEALHLY